MNVNAYVFIVRGQDREIVAEFGAELDAAGFIINSTWQKARENKRCQWNVGNQMYEYALRDLKRRGEYLVTIRTKPIGGLAEFARVASAFCSWNVVPQQDWSYEDRVAWGRARGAWELMFGELGPGEAYSFMAEQGFFEE